MMFLGNAHHQHGKKPAFVFTPAIGPTEILKIKGNEKAFKDWDGSLMVSSLRANSLFRLEMDGPRVVYSEPIINLGERIRFLRQGEDGSLYAKGDPDSFFIVQLDWPGIRREDAAVEGGTSVADLVEGQCVSCHKRIGFAELPGVPPIFNYNKETLIRILTEYSSGIRKSDVMNGQMQGLSDKRINEIADYVSTHTGH